MNQYADKRKDYFRSMVALNVKAMRRHLGMTQTELAEKVGVSKHTILRLEKEMFSPSFQDVIMICEVLGVEPSEIYKPLDIDYD